MGSGVSKNKHGDLISVKAILPRDCDDSVAEPKGAGEDNTKILLPLIRVDNQSSLVNNSSETQGERRIFGGCSIGEQDATRA